MQTNILLHEFPALWNRLEAEKERVVQSYHASGGNYCNGKGYDVSDPTAASVVRLCLLDEWVSAMKLTEEWLDTHLSPELRSVLLDVWRDKFGPKKEDVAWITMVNDLKTYLEGYAGHASGEHGPASASGRKRKSRA